MTRDSRHRNRKRSHDQYDQDRSDFGLGATVQQLKDEANGTHTADSPQEKKRRSSNDKSADDDEGWEVADSHRNKKRKKMPKKDGNNYPSISHSSHSRLQTFVKLGDLQNLVLYLLADAPAPQWCAVRHSGNVRKVVALMVPGLEAGLFDGSIDLSPAKNEEQQENGEANTTADNSELEQNGNKDPDSKNASETSSFQGVKKNSKSRPSPDDYYPSKLKKSSLPESLQPLAEIFDHIWPVKTPGEDKSSRMHSPMAAMLTAPIVKTKEEKNSKGVQPPREGKNWKNHRTPITEFIATTPELIEEGYVMHPSHFSNTADAAAEVARRETSKTTEADGWVDTREIPDLAAGDVPEKEIEQGSLLKGRKVLVMDCEMCITSPAGTMPQVFSLTRISLIDWDGNVVMDELVKPEQPITDYVTPYSGITPEMLKRVTTTLPDVQKKLLDIITPHTILIGHSLVADLNAVQLTHPFIVDTALLFPHPRGPPLKSSLKWLSQKYLSRDIQKGHGSTGHNSVEDAQACLDLVKQKCEKGKTWGTSEASAESIFKRLGRQNRQKRHKVIPAGNDEPRVGAVVDWGDPKRGYGYSAEVAVGCENDEEVVAGMKHALDGDDDGKQVPHGGVDFVFARFRELEAYRGWWNSSKTADADTRRDNANAATDASSLSEVVAQTVQHVKEVWESLPPCTALILYSGSGDPRELSEMQAMQQQFKDEYRVKKWDELSVRWTDVEEQRLRAACAKARMGVGFLTVK